MVQDVDFAVLPNISPPMTFILTLAAQIVRVPYFDKVQSSSQYCG